MFAVLAQIARGQFSLRPRQQQQPDQQQQLRQQDEDQSRRKGAAASSPMVPSLADILSAKNRLRKTTRPADQQHIKHEPHDIFPFLKEIRSGNFKLRPVSANADPQIL